MTMPRSYSSLLAFFTAVCALSFSYNTNTASAFKVTISLALTSRVKMYQHEQQRPLFVSSPARAPFPLLHSHSMSDDDDDDNDNVVERLGLEKNFDRWRFMQNMLEFEVKTDDVNRILFLVLDGYLKYPRPIIKDEDDGDVTGSPDLTPETKIIIEQLLSDQTQEKMRVCSLDNNNGSPGEEHVLQQLAKLLPDPQEDEDAHKGTWDIVLALHGRDGVRINESMNPKTPQWIATSLVARILIHYDFLTLGIVDKPLM